MKKLCLLCLLIAPVFFASTLLAQPANNDCSSAITLTNLSNWCSSNAAFTNIGATQTDPSNPSCFPQNTIHDVWFSFVAVATTVHITVIGNTTGNQAPGGTLVNPQFAIYTGNCGGALNQVACASDNFNNNIVESFASPLIVGQTYYVRVDGRNGATGTFRLCINNYNAVPDPNSDCPTGVILCDKSSFNVESLVGTGALDNEFDQNICIQTEFASAWYRWTCKDPGTLTFNITPTNPSDDIDFALFELPAGIDDCDNKVKIRCEAAGETVGAPFSEWEICTGPTGLSLGETDTDEAPGCAAGQNNYVAAIDMIVGKSYALIINNFSNTGNGFSIDFGGTGTFLGPTADFNFAPSTVCTKQDVTFTDASSSVDGITNWQWSFGLGATPATATGAGPHNVSFTTPGNKSIVLTITSGDGCIVTFIQNITVLPSPEVDPDIISDYCGPDDATGGITLTPTGGAQPYLYNWQGSGTFSPDSTLSDLNTGPYNVTVQDANGCQQAFSFVVPEGLSLAGGWNPVTPPTCNGDSDGSISISLDIANYPVTFDFGNGPQPDSILANIPAGTYNVLVVDNAGCDGLFTIVVDDFPVLSLGLDSLDISCFSQQDGTITAIPAGGAGGYIYQWSNGEATSTIDSLAAGIYGVTVTDENGCTIEGTAGISEPPELVLSVNVVDVICHGDASGVIVFNAIGGTPPFEYSADGINFQPDPNVGNLLAGNYNAVVMDSRGCLFEVEDVIVNEPPPLIVEAGPDQTIDLGYTADIRATVAPLFRPVTISWNPSATLDCTDCLDPTAMPFGTTTYYISIIDETACTAIDSVTINVILNRPIYIPNAFSPNGDGINDYFTVYGGPAVKGIRALKVFARWGNMVFEGYDLTINNEPMGWDGTFKGKQMNPSVFAYLAEVEFIDGVVVLYEGDVTIVR
ncbi:MAG: gliding motility-associated C-terminal domain-containing protein [Saprospiraceae bacterium]